MNTLLQYVEDGILYVCPPSKIIKKKQQTFAKYKDGRFYECKIICSNTNKKLLNQVKKNIEDKLPYVYLETKNIFSQNTRKSKIWQIDESSLTDKAKQEDCELKGNSEICEVDESTSLTLNNARQDCELNDILGNHHSQPNVKGETGVLDIGTEICEVDESTSLTLNNARQDCELNDILGNHHSQPNVKGETGVLDIGTEICEVDESTSLTLNNSRQDCELNDILGNHHSQPNVKGETGVLDIGTEICEVDKSTSLTLNNARQDCELNDILGNHDSQANEKGETGVLHIGELTTAQLESNKSLDNIENKKNDLNEKIIIHRVETLQPNKWYECSLTPSINNSELLDLVTHDDKVESNECSLTPSINNSELLDLVTHDDKVESNIRTSKSSHKKHSCLFCGKVVSQIARHLLTQHSQENEVRQIKLLHANNPLRKRKLDMLRKKGDFEYNKTNPSVQIVVRSSSVSAENPGTKYVPCPSCFGLFSATNLRHHKSTCSPQKGDRKLQGNARKLIDCIHERASEKLRSVVTPHMFRDEVANNFLFDEMIILYGNYLCVKYTQDHLKNHVRAQLRLLGRFMQRVKAIDTSIQSFKTLLHPGNCDVVRQAIDMVAALDEVRGIYNHPFNGRALGTAIQKVADIMKSESIKLGEQNLITRCEAFLNVYKIDVAPYLNRICALSEKKQNRAKQGKRQLPEKENTQRYFSYLLQQASVHQERLEQEFQYNDWKMLSQYLLVALAVFNRKRPGESQHIELEDFHMRKGLDEQELNSLNRHDDKLQADRYVRVGFGGKLGNATAILIDKEKILPGLLLILKYRSEAGVHNENRFLFGAPSKTDQHKTFSTYQSHQQFLTDSGLDSSGLSFTTLRYHLATEVSKGCTSREEEIRVSNYMSHDYSIHKTIYDQSTVMMDITKVSKHLEASTSGIAHHNKPKSPYKNASDTSMPAEPDRTDVEVCLGKYQARTPWTSQRKQAAREYFHEEFGNVDLEVDNKKIRKFKVLHSDVMKNRTVPMIKQWIVHERKKRISKSLGIEDCTPSPADYVVKLADKNKGVALSQTERFIELRSPTISENGSSNSTPCFRTPLNPKLKKKIVTELKEKPKQKDLLHKDLELLNEKIVECRNKDSYIKDLMEQLDAMKDKVAELENLKCKFESEKSLLEKQFMEVTAVHKQNVNDLKKQHRNRLAEVNSQIIAIREELTQLYQQYNKQKQDLNVDFKKVEKKQGKCFEEIMNCLKVKSLDIMKKEKEMQLLRDSWNEIQNKHKTDLENLKALHNEELEFLRTSISQGLFDQEEDIDKLIGDKNIIVKEVLVYIKNEYKKLEIELSLKLEEEREKNTEIHESELVLKQKIQETENNFKMKLEAQEKEHNQILKECQAISEYNIIQCELEKNDVKEKLLEAETENTHLNKEFEEVSNRYTALMASYNKLQADFEKMENDLSSMQDQMSKGIENNDIQINQLLSEINTYKISISKCQETIQVLTKRLMNSDKDVEQLKDELRTCESKLLIYESKCMHLNTELQELSNLIGETEMQNELFLKIIEADEMKVKKLENYRIDSEKQINTLKEQLLEKEAECNSMKEYLHEQQKTTSDCEILVSKVENHLEKVESQNTDLKIKNEELDKVNEELIAKVCSLDQLKNKCSELEKTLTYLTEENNNLQKKLQTNNIEIAHLGQKLQQTQEENNVNSQNCDYYKSQLEGNKNELDDAVEIRRKYIEQSMKYEELFGKFEILQKENELQRKLVAEQESLIGPFREQLEKYELERKALLTEKDYMENEAREMGLKYAEILGHQNHKQKIKHLINLKSKNDELTKNNLELDSKVRSQSRTIEKLKKENADFKKMKKYKSTGDKENFISPNVSLNSSKIDSPGPLRERN